MRLKCAGLTDTGMVREHNEDSFLVSQTESFVVVADGMGGHQSGEVASSMAIKEIMEYYDATIHQEAPIELPFWPSGKPKPSSREERRVIAALVKANSVINKAAGENPKYNGMGTTCVSAYFVEEGVIIAHVGDSRCYRLRKGVLEQMTEDHSLANEYIRQGILKPEDLRSFPYKNVITRAIGLADTVEVETNFYKHEDGDIYLLCSDGLSDPVKEPQLVEILTKYSNDLPKACRELIIAANQNGGPDNVTALLAKTVY
ncbi:MAG: Stp1/IreP family PP2C-type Ser/Thr phosphatase [Proteobacteria bacterium]|nr:Stp1/IreP family PP2C-type Ser/Thr phosphatase [Pseudomonadota bacterium]